ncbi:hypothetical protein BXZ70DRAFT_940275 [Cristinia sonorae]|uniref:Uncharacterized protein n=1 Tax=Cristinia sonorae TaxID=1940300 RepID=A0A8K0UPR6_9AGAR|nr:hypothetical protein BXZ70DRAFT_940275 [Cristinia sonorae]
MFTAELKTHDGIFTELVANTLVAVPSLDTTSFAVSDDVQAIIDSLHLKFPSSDKKEKAADAVRRLDENFLRLLQHVYIAVSDLRNSVGGLSTSLAATRRDAPLLSPLLERLSDAEGRQRNLEDSLTALNPSTVDDHSFTALWDHVTGLTTRVAGLTDRINVTQEPVLHSNDPCRGIEDYPDATIDAADDATSTFNLHRFPTATALVDRLHSSASTLHTYIGPHHKMSSADSSRPKAIRAGYHGFSTEEADIICF